MASENNNQAPRNLSAHEVRNFIKTVEGALSTGPKAPLYDSVVEAMGQTAQYDILLHGDERHPLSREDLLNLKPDAA